MNVTTQDGRLLPLSALFSYSLDGYILRVGAFRCARKHLDLNQNPTMLGTHK